MGARDVATARSDPYDPAHPEHPYPSQKERGAGATPDAGLRLARPA